MSGSSSQRGLLERRGVPLVFVVDLDNPVLDDADAHHFGRVRRISDGSPITIGDGHGRWRHAAFGSQPDPTGPIMFEADHRIAITIGFVPVKGERPEWVVQKLTELGVATIVPLLSERSIVRWDAAKASKQQEKWQLVAREAAMQSRRVHLPVIGPVTPINDIGPSASTFIADPDGPPLATEPWLENDRVTVLIGPEGGFTDRERSRHPSRSLPGGVLRAETAALVAATILQANLPV